MSPDRHWTLIDSLQFINNLSLSLPVDEQLNIVIRRLFTEISGKLMLYSGCNQALHILSNAISDEVGELSGFELSALKVDENARSYLDLALEARHGANLPEIKEHLPEYISLRAEGFVGRGIQSNLCDNLAGQDTPCFPVVQKAKQWDDIFRHVNKEIHALKDSDGQQPIHCKASFLLVIPLSRSSRKLPNGSLGTILLWDDEIKDKRDQWMLLEERLLLASKFFTAFTHQLLTSRYGVTEETYLPSFQIPGERRVAIMFLNIQNFSQTTEVARNFNLIPELTELMREFHQEMCETIRRYHGRVNNLVSDGIMAIFGEHEIEDMAAQAAVKAAKEMCHRFDALKERFYQKGRIQDFISKEYEPIDFRLSIGINLGSVIFDYFGVPGSRTYGPLGDHVNFAQHLVYEANRYDEREKRVRAPILISRPLWFKSGLDKTTRPLVLHLKDKIHEYPAYECWP
jgi:class 3 adenylate cyclase